MKFNIKSAVIIPTILLLVSCTGNFEDLNTNPNGITDEQLEQDYNTFSVYYADIERYLINTTDWEYQLTQNLTADIWANYWVSGTLDGANNQTYQLTWPDQKWNDIYDEVLPAAQQVIEMAEEEDEPAFGAWAKLLKVYGLQELTSIYGPIIYADYGAESGSSYDSEEEVYHELFADLDDVIESLSNFIGFEGFQNGDVSTYGGNVEQWIKMANSLRLQLALRIVYADEELAKTEAKKAIEQSVGLIASNNDNFGIDLGADPNPIGVIGYDWGDIRMSGTMESFLVGYDDPRIEEYFAPVEDLSLVPNHPDIPFKGVKSGSKIEDVGARVDLSAPGTVFQDESTWWLLTYADVNFMLSEASLRWPGLTSGDAQFYYEEGVKASFEDWGAAGAEAYLTDDSSTPIDYKDTSGDNEGGINNFDAQTDITVKWENGDSKERKLERIMTQKWIASFPNSFWAWEDFRRTGYPKLEPIADNRSSAGDGVIPDGDFIRRMRFVPGEYDSNESSVQEAINKLGGPDEIGTPLWWDNLHGPNF